MKVYIQLILLQSLLLILFGALFIGINQKSQKNLEETRQALEAKEAFTFDHLVSLKRESLNTLAWDYSYWQDMIDWMEAPTLDWVYEQFEESLDTYDSDFFCIYDATGKRLTPTFDPNLIALKDPEEQMPLQLPQLILQRPKEQWFQPSFEQTPRGIREVYYAPIQPQSDSDRSGKHYGYLVIARYWDSDFIQSLETLTGTVISHEGTLDNAEPVAPDSAHIVFERSYRNFQSQAIINLHISKELPVASEMIEQQANYRQLLFIACLIGGISLLTFIYITISRPLRKLSTAMETGDNKVLDNITQSQSEFRHLARLIVENKKRKEQLEAEIEKRRKFEEQLFIEKTKAEQANRAKSQFLANIGHETRTPLHMISGFTALLNDSELDEDQRSTLEHIRENADHLVKMLTDIIDLSSIETGGLTLQHRDIHVDELFDEIIAAAHSHAFPKDLEVITKLSEDVPATIHTDYAQLRRALLSIMENAIKFTDEGRITIRAYTSPQKNGSAVIFEISDTGIGISQEQLEHIFDAFYQIDDSDSRRYGGGGLGLAITRGIAQLIGGHIEVESELDRGTTIRLILPASAIQPPSKASA